MRQEKSGIHMTRTGCFEKRAEKTGKQCRGDKEVLRCASHMTAKGKF